MAGQTLHLNSSSHAQALSRLLSGWPNSHSCSWHLLHAGTVLPSGEEVAAPNTVGGMISHLSTTFKILGRQGPWCEGTRTGNPTECTTVQLWKRGYGRQMRSKGYAESSAIPWEEDAVHAVIDTLLEESDEQQREAAEQLASGTLHEALRATVKALCLERDATAAAYLWEGLQRGKEAGALARSDFADEHGQEVLGRLPFLFSCSPEELRVSRALVGMHAA